MYYSSTRAVSYHGVSLSPDVGRLVVITPDARDDIFWFIWSILCLLMRWLLKSPMHERYWRYSIGNMWDCSTVNLVFFYMGYMEIFCILVYRNGRQILRMGRTAHFSFSVITPRATNNAKIKENNCTCNINNHTSKLFENGYALINVHITMTS